MSKICILADSHWGIRSDNQYFYNYQKKFIDKILIPAIVEHNCEHVIHLGDVVDNRRSLNIQTATHLHEDFLMPLMRLHNETGLNVHFILGNHDVFYKQNKNINVFQEILKAYPFKMYENPQEITIGNKNILMLPWITPEGRNFDMEFINKSKADYCMAHLELKGFEQTKGHLALHGDDPKLFSQFKLVFSGHYHNRSKRDNIFYIGSCFQFNWGDAGNDSGVVILDTETDTILEIGNPYSMFNTIEYDEGTNVLFPVEWKNTYIRVNVLNKKSETKFNKFIESIHQVGIADLLINENLPPMKVSKKQIQTNNTLDIFKDSINSLDFELKDELSLLMEDTYKEAISIL